MRGSFSRILLVTLLLQTAVYALRPMVSYKAISVGANLFELGVIASSFAVLSLLVAVSIGRWVDRWGEPRFLIAGSAVISAVCLSLIWIESVWALAVSQALLGLGHILSVVATQTLVANRGDPKRRDGRFGMFTVIVSLGQLAGPAAAGLVAGSAVTGASERAPGGVGAGGVFIGAAVIALIATLVATTLLRRGQHARTEPMQATAELRPGAQSPPSYWMAVARVLRIPSMPHAMLASLTVLTTIDIIAAYLPAYGEANSLSVETVGLLLATRAAGSMASRLFLVPLLRLLALRRLLALSTILPALSLAIFPFLESPPLLYAALALAGVGLGLGQPVTLTWVAGEAPQDIRGTALGVRLTGNRLGQMVLPVAIGAIAGTSNVVAVFVALAGLLGFSTLAVLTADFSRAPTSEEE